MWQWIHYSYGEDLGLESDDNDYVTLSVQDKVEFQKQLQMEEQRASDTSLVSDNTADKVWYYLYDITCHTTMTAVHWHFIHLINKILIMCFYYTVSQNNVQTLKRYSSTL